MDANAENAQKTGMNKMEPCFSTEKPPRSPTEAKSGKELEGALQIEKGKSVKQTQRTMTGGVGRT